MCDLLFVVLPLGRHGLLRDALPEGLSLSKIENRCLADRLPDGYQAMAVVTRNGCSCGVVYDPDQHEREMKQEFDSAQKRRVSKYMAKGWSQAKIDRALRDSESAADCRADDCGRKEEQLVALESAIASAAGEALDGLLLLIHGFSGSFAEERFPIGLASVPVGELRLRPGLLPYDTLVQVGA